MGGQTERGLPGLVPSVPLGRGVPGAPACRARRGAIPTPPALPARRGRVVQHRPTCPPPNTLRPSCRWPEDPQSVLAPVVLRGLTPRSPAQTSLQFLTPR